MVKILFKKKTGFTLVESLVAITVFLVVVTTVSSIYISFVRQERKLYSFLKTENNIRFALDYMGRDIRMAKSYDLGNNFQKDGETLLTFNDYKDQLVTYALNGTNIKVSRSGSDLLLLDPSVEINYLKFYITNGIKGSDQPTVIIALEATDKNNNFTYSLETAVTPRNLNLE